MATKKEVDAKEKAAMAIAKRNPSTMSDGIIGPAVRNIGREPEEELTGAKLTAFRAENLRRTKSILQSYRSTAKDKNHEVVQELLKVL